MLRGQLQRNHSGVWVVEYDLDGLRRFRSEMDLSEHTINDSDFKLVPGMDVYFIAIDGKAVLVDVSTVEVSTPMTSLLKDVKKLKATHMRPELLDDVEALIYFYLPSEKLHLRLAHADGFYYDGPFDEYYYLKYEQPKQNPN